MEDLGRVRGCAMSGPQGPVEPMVRAERPIDPNLRIGHVHLRTADIDRVREFYAGIMGFDGLDCRLEGIQSASDGLAERADLRVGYRLPPGITTSELDEELRAICASHHGESSVKVVHGAVEEPVRTPRSSPLAQAFIRSIAQAGANGTFKVKSGTSDMNILAPAWGCPMVAYGPGDSSYDHTPMERLALRDYTRAIAVLRGVLRRLVS